MADSSPATGSSPSPSTYAWLATVPLIWGTHFVALKVVFEDYSVYGMLSVRYSLMIVALLALLWVFERDMRFSWRDVPYLAGFSLFMVTLYQIVFAMAIQWATAAESALLISTAPIFTALAAAGLGWERITRQLLVGVVLGFVGIIAVVFGGQGMQHLPEASTHLLGCATMLIAAVMWALYAVLAKPLLAKYSPLKVTTYCQTLGGLAIIPLGLSDALETTPRVISQLSDPALASHASWVLFGLVYYALFSGAYSFTVWYRGVQRLGSARTMMFQFCVPVVGLVAAIVVRGEYPSALQWLGAALTLGGVIAAARRPRTASPTNESASLEGRETVDAVHAASSDN